MAGRKLLDEAVLLAQGYDHPDLVKRRVILRETLDALEKADPPDTFHRIAFENLERWKQSSSADQSPGQVRVIAGDWGEVTRSLSREFGVCFAVLNMANAYIPGGGYVEGMSAQEENMFRRTDCHFRVDPSEIDPDSGHYTVEMTRLISAEDGAVYLDSERPRICLRGPEDRSRPDLGYDWLDHRDIFPFYELRAAAQDLRFQQVFDPAEARHRIAAKLDTLRSRGITHAVLGAMGCGAFRNPPAAVAKIYRQEIDRRRADFALLAFAILNTGANPSVLPAFTEAFDDFDR